MNIVLLPPSYPAVVCFHAEPTGDIQNYKKNTTTFLDVSADELAAGYEGRCVCVRGEVVGRLSVLHSHFDRYSLISPAHFSVSASLSLLSLLSSHFASCAGSTSSPHGVPRSLTLASAPVTQTDSFTSQGVQSDPTAVE